MPNIIDNFIPLSNDLLFKEVLCHSETREYLIYILKILTNIDEFIIRNSLVVKYESILNKTNTNDKIMRGDIIIEFSDYIINLEAYNGFNNNSLKKSTSYIMRLFSTQLRKGKKYQNMKKVWQINIVDKFNFTKYNKSEYVITNRLNSEETLLQNDFLIKYYVIDKIREIPYNELDDEMRIIRFIGAKSYEERKLVAEGDDMLMELNNWIDDYMFDEQTKKYYHEWDMEIRKELALEKQVEEIAKTMLKEGYDKKEVKKITKIPISRLNTLL